MIYRYSFDSALCSGCGACAVACMDLNDIDLKAGDAPFHTVSVTETPGKTPLLTFTSSACRHCEKPVCMEVCKYDCLIKDPETGFISVDDFLCAGCLTCVFSCPYGAVDTDRNGKASKCHGCSELIKRGLDPACVRACPTGALKLEINDE